MFPDAPRYFERPIHTTIDAFSTTNGYFWYPAYCSIYGYQKKITLGIFFTEIVSYMSIMDPKLLLISQNMKKNACLSQNI
jgi:hypothetical protein